MLVVFHQPENVAVERHHLVQIIDIEHHVTESFDRWHGQRLLSSIQQHFIRQRGLLSIMSQVFL
jgi:hypothetical protein